MGIEIAIDGTPVSGKNFTWNTAVNFSRNRNLIVDLYPGRTEFNLSADIAEISTWAVVGKSYGTLRTTIAQQPFQAVDANGNKIDDPRNGLPILNWRGDARAAFPKRSNYLQDVGDINAKFRFGWDNTFRYKNFSLNVLLMPKLVVTLYWPVTDLVHTQAYSQIHLKVVMLNMERYHLDK